MLGKVMANKYLFLILMTPCLSWLFIPAIYSPWYLENLLSSPLVMLLGFLAITIIFMRYLKMKIVILSFIVNAFVIGLSCYKNMANNMPEHCSKPIKIFQFNTMYDNLNTQELTIYLKKQKYDLVVLQEIAPMIRKELIKGLSPIYTNFITGISQTNHITTDQLIFSQHQFTHKKYHLQNSASHLIQSQWHIDKIPLHLFTIHSPSPRSHILWKSRNLSFYQLMAQIKLLNNKKVILVGDFNLSSHSSRIEQFTKVVSGKYIGSWPNLGYVPTYFTLAIDHLFVSDSIKLCSRERILGFDYSDHYPIATNISL